MSGQVPDSDDLHATIAALRSQVAEQKALIERLLAEVAELKRRLDLDSSNSSKPPSSDGLKKPVRTRSLREASGLKPGGQKGHRGQTRCQSQTPDIVIDHYPQSCRGCGEALAVAMAEGHVARQVFDLPAPQPLFVTEHRAHFCRCPTCGLGTRAGFPEGVAAPVQYGARLKAAVVYLLHYQLLPERRLCALMADLFGARLSGGTIGRISKDAARRFQDVVAAIGRRVAVADVKNLDETGFRVAGKTRWLHIASTPRLTFYRVEKKRGGLPRKLSGIAVHDHWKPYYSLKGVRHALCNAHHLRELKALAEIENEKWARRLQTLLKEAAHQVNDARRVDKALTQATIKDIRRRYDAIIRDGLAYHERQPALSRAGPSSRPSRRRRLGHNLLLRLQKRKRDVLRFLENPAVPFSNNLAEQDARMMKLRQKISGGFRSEGGARDFAIIRSILSTARKQAWDILKTLATSPNRLAAQIA